MAGNIHGENCCATHGCYFGENEKCAVYLGSVPQLNRCGEVSLCAGFSFHDIDDCDDNAYPEP